MQKNSDNFPIQEAMRLASTSAGQELIGLLRQSNAPQLQQAAEQASAGNYAQAQELLKGLLADPQIRTLLKTLGR